MKNLLTSAILILPFWLFAQELDEDYLESLPDGVREDVMAKMEEDKTEKPIYRSPSTMIDKDILSELDRDFLDEIRKKLDSITARLENEDELGLRVFGSQFFDSLQSSFMPVNEPNLDGNYMIGYGDSLEIQLVGQQNTIEEYIVNRDGSINLPEVGKIDLLGKTLDDAKMHIKSKINDSFVGTNAFISLKNIRDIKVLVTGNAYSPGIYTLNGNSNILHALNIAGGIDKIGSYRNIELIRNNKVIDTLDLYEILIFGKSNFGKSLRSGDSILVNPLTRVVNIESGVRRPGLYEILNNETIEDLIIFANGFLSNIDENNISLKRSSQGKLISSSIKREDIDAYQLKDGDSLFIKEYKNNTVFLEGAVKNPGTYSVPNNTTLSMLIAYAGGYEDLAYPFGGYLDNKNTYEINATSKENLYNKFLMSLITSSASNSQNQNQSLPLILKQLRESPVTGRIIAEFDTDAIAGDPELDTFLQDGDKILVPYITQQVYVQGEVSNPGAVKYESLEDLSYYIDASGGSLDSADKTNIYIVHPNGETIKYDGLSNFVFSSKNYGNDLIYPGSIIFIPQKSSLVNNLEAASIWAPIISSVALSLTSLSVLNND